MGEKIGGLPMLAAATGGPGGTAPFSPAMPSSAQPWMAGAGADPNAPAPSAAPAASPEMPDPSFGPSPIKQGQNQQPAAPGQTKAHKLLSILQSGVQGALAGRAADEQAVLQSGGHRNAGIGTGFEAGFTLPWQRQQMEQNLAKEKAQTALLQSQTELVDTPYGRLPPALAKAIFPAAIGAEAKRDVADTNAGARTGAATINAKGRTDAAQIGQKFKAVPGVGLFDTETRQVVPGTASGVTITPEIAQDYQLPPEFVGKPMNVAQLASLEKAASSNLSTVQGAEGPALVNKQKGTAKTLGLGSPAVAAAQARPVQAATDPNNPGELTYTTAGNAIKTGAAAPGSASVQTARTAAKSEVPTKIGDQKVAFNTMLAHADLLRQAAKALQNGDVRTVNTVRNKLKTEFGDGDYTNLQAIANAYNHEVTSVIAKGHISDAEVGTGARTLPVDANFDTINKVLNSYEALAKSKMENLNKQKDAAVNSANPKAQKGKEIHYKVVNGQLVAQ